MTNQFMFILILLLCTSTALTLVAIGFRRLAEYALLSSAFSLLIFVDEIEVKSDLLENFTTLTAGEMPKGLIFAKPAFWLFREAYKTFDGPLVILILCGCFSILLWCLAFKSALEQIRDKATSSLRIGTFLILGIFVMLAVFIYSPFVGGQSLHLLFQGLSSAFYVYSLTEKKLTKRYSLLVLGSLIHPLNILVCLVVSLTGQGCSRLAYRALNTHKIRRRLAFTFSSFRHTVMLIVTVIGGIGMLRVTPLYTRIEMLVELLGSRGIFIRPSATILLVTAICASLYVYTINRKRLKIEALDSISAFFLAGSVLGLAFGILGYYPLANRLFYSQMCYWFFVPTMSLAFIGIRSRNVVSILLTISLPMIALLRFDKVYSGDSKSLSEIPTSLKR